MSNAAATTPAVPVAERSPAARLALPEPGPHVPRLLPAFAAATFLLQLTCLTQYGWFRDELYYMACTSHLSWGYVDQPPLSIALLALVRAAFGESLVAARMVAALLGALTVALTGRLAREAGGGRFAQILACLCALLAPVFLGSAHYYSMNVLELALWPAAMLALLRALRGGRVADWALLGVLLGLGLENKLSASWLVLGLGVALLLTPHRRALRTAGPWLALAIAAALFLPHALWQVAHGFPTLEFMRNATGQKMVAVAPLAFFREQLVAMGPGNALVWIAGLVFALAVPRLRILAWPWVVTCVLLLASGHSRASYLSPAYPMLFAAGAAAWERMLARVRWLRPLIPAVVVALGLIAIPFALPILPVQYFLHYQRALGMSPHTEEHQRMGALPQQYADMFGWNEMVALVQRAAATLTPEERRRARVFGQNYGEASAVNVLGRRLGLPPAISGHNSYWLWGPQGWDGSVLIIIGGDPADNARWFDSVEIIGTVDAPLAMPYERRNVSIGRGLRMPVAQAWPRLKGYI